MLLYNIGELLQVRTAQDAYQPVNGQAMSQVPSIINAWVKCENNKIVDFGSMSDLKEVKEESCDMEGAIVGPSYVDSHTHLVFAKTRENEFVDKIKGATYAEIAAKGGGILNSARALAEMSEDELFLLASERLQKVMKWGTGAIEIKSGYGLSKEAELKMLRVIRRLKRVFPLPIKATFLGAHALPMQYNGNTDAYVDHVIAEILPEVVQEGLADYIDVFCEKGFFNVHQTEKIVQAGAKVGLKAKIHANQLNNSGGIQVGVSNQAISVDHLETMGVEEIEVLKGGKTIPTLLPGAAFFLRMSYPPARELIKADLPVCIASDYNPGSSPCGNMNAMFSLSCIQMKMTPQEVYNAITMNGAAALELLNEVGSITVGKRADLIVYNQSVKNLDFIPYNFGETLVQKRWVNNDWL